MLVKTIKADMVQAMKNRNEEVKTTLRLLLAKLEQEKVKFKLGDVLDLTEEQVITVIKRNVKEIEKEIESYVAVNRTTEKQEAEIELLKTYLPPQLTELELIGIVQAVAESTKATGGKIGDAMKTISSLVNGQADMKVVSKMMSEEMKK